MGHNLISFCHKCKVKVFHFRHEENETILPFYYKHRNCAKLDIENVQTVMDNNGNDLKCMDDFRNGGYNDEIDLKYKD